MTDKPSKLREWIDDFQNFDEIYELNQTLLSSNTKNGQEELMIFVV